MRISLRFIIIGLVVLTLGVGGFWLYQNQFAGNSQAAMQADGFTQIVTVQQGDLDATISVVGELYAPQNEVLLFERIADATTLKSLDVQPGYVVERGQFLASIDPSEYEQTLDQARSDLQEAEARSQDLQTPASDLDIATADLAIARAELAQQQAQERLDELLSPDIEDLQVTVADVRLSLAQAQEDLLQLEIDTGTTDRIAELKEMEAERSADYTRLVHEGYSDSYYQDRLRVAYDALLDAEDARITAEIERQMDLLKAQIAVRKAEWALSDAQAALADAEGGSDDLDVASAEQALAQAETDLLAAQEQQAEFKAGADPVDLSAAQAEVDKKRLAVTEAEADLAGTDLLAPFPGTILNVHAEPGDRITASTDILTIANLNELQVVASIDETTIRQVAVGQPVRITFDAFPGQIFNGAVLSVPLQGELQGDVMVYEVPISLQGAEELPLLVGMTANAEIKVGEVSGALLVPTMALQNQGGFYQVLIANRTDPEANPEAVPVEVGLSNGMYTEIVRGLNPGDQVVVQIEGTESTTDFRAMGRMLGDSGRPSQPPRDRN